MGRISEKFDGGLVTSRDPADLAPGELQQCDNACYFPNTDGLHRAPARTNATSSGLGGAITGLAYCSFDVVEVDCALTKDSTTVTPVTVTVANCTTVSGSTEINTTGTFVGLRVGAVVTGTGIAASSTIASIFSVDRIYLNNAATANGTVTLTFASEDFDGVSVGAAVAGVGIPDGATVATKTDRTTITLSSAATHTTKSRLKFGADDLLIAQANSKYQKAAVSGTGVSLTFSDLESVTTGDTLERVHYGNRWVLLNGKNANRVLQPDGTTRVHGLKAVDARPTVATAAGTWALQSGTGYYAYWTTEVLYLRDPSDPNFTPNDIIESTFSGDPARIGVTATSQKVNISVPPRVNNEATHWRIYRSPKLDATSLDAANNEPVELTGFLVATQEFRADQSQDTVSDGGGATSTASNAGSVGTVGTNIYGETWASAGNATGASNGAWAQASATHTTEQTGLIDYLSKTAILLELSGFSFTFSSNPGVISGLTVTVTGKKDVNAKLYVQPALTTDPTEGPGGTISIGNAKIVPLTTSNASYALGSSSDTWGRTWNASNFTSGTFCVRLYAVLNRVPPGGGTVDSAYVDAVNVSVSYGKNQSSTAATDPGPDEGFPAIEIRPFGIPVVVGRDGKPPKATTGDVFQDSLVLNDVTDDSVVRYSFPTRIDSFPSEYYINFDTKDQDEVTLIRTVGNVMAVAMNSQIYRTNFLPRAEHSEFNRGSAVELIESGHGIPGARCGTVFSIGGALHLFYVNNYGPFLTDCYRVREATEDLDWPATVDVNNVHKTLVVNNAELYMLEVYYVPVDAASTTYPSKVLFFHYHPRHLKQGPEGMMLKVSGPFTLTVGAAEPAVLSSGIRRIYTGETSGSFHVKYEDVLDGSGAVSIKTRKMFLAGKGNEWSMKENYLHYTQRDTMASPTNITVTPTVYKTGAAARTGTAKTFTLPSFSGGTATHPKNRRIDVVSVAEHGEAIDLTYAWNPSGAERGSFESFVVDGEGFAEEEK